MDTDSFSFNAKTENWYKYISNDVEKRFDISNIQTNIPIKKGINKKVFATMKDELNGKCMKWAKIQMLLLLARLLNNWKKSLRSKKCVTKKNLKFNHNKHCSINNTK